MRAALILAAIVGMMSGCASLPNGGVGNYVIGHTPLAVRVK